MSVIMGKVSSKHDDWYIASIIDKICGDESFDYDKLADMFEWCEVNVGEESINWVWSYNIMEEPDIYDFHFKNSSDAIIFKLTWA
jgi:hypothetical protein